MHVSATVAATSIPQDVDGTSESNQLLAASATPAADHTYAATKFTSQTDSATDSVQALPDVGETSSSPTSPATDAPKTTAHTRPITSFPAASVTVTVLPPAGCIDETDNSTSSEVTNEPSRPGLASATSPTTTSADLQIPTAIMKPSKFYPPSGQNCIPTSNISHCIKKLSLLPKASSRVCKRKVESAEILTSSPYKNNLMSKEEAKKNKDSKRKERKQKVRKDKPRGRKPKVAEPVAATCDSNQTPEHAKLKPRSRTKLKLASPVTDNSDDCAGCGEHVSRSASDWLQCRKCKSWREEECA
jgi:hypothetical protein